MSRNKKLSHLPNEDRKHTLHFETYEDKPLKGLTYRSKDQTKIILDKMYNNVIDYCSYYNKKYYKAEFSDCLNLVIRSLK